MLQFWLFALRNLQRNFKRNLATGSAIALGFAGIILLGGYAHRVNRHLAAYTIYTAHTGHLAIFAKDGFENQNTNPKNHSLHSEDQIYLAAIFKNNPNIEFFEKQLRGQGLIGNGCLSFPFIAFGYEPEIDRQLKDHPEVKKWMPHDFSFFSQGRGLWNYPDQMGAVLLSGGLAKALGKLKVHDEVNETKVSLVDCKAPDYKAKMSADANVQLLAGTWEGTLTAVDGESVGIFSTGMQEADNSAILAPVTLLQRLFDTENIAQFSVWLKDSSKVSAVQNSLLEQFSKDGKNFQTIRWNEERLSPYFVGTTTFVNVIVLSVAIVLTTIIGLSVLNAVTMTILERTQEIGMYRAMGFRKSHLHLLYLLESIWLSLISLVFGLILGLIATYVINSSHIIYHPPGMSEGLQLLLVPHWSSASISALAIIIVVWLSTTFGVYSRLRIGPADLLGGILR